MTEISRRGLLVAGGAAAAAWSFGAPALASKRLKVGALRFTSHAPSFVALERGYFAEAGLEVEFEFFQAAQPMAVAVASGDIDYAVTAISGGLVSLAQKGAAKVIGGALREEPGVDGQEILASNAAFEAGLTSAAQLGGKRFGVTQPGSSFHYMGSRIGEAEGAVPTFVPLQKVGAVIGALKSGQIDAWSIVPHIAKALAGSGAVRSIGKVADYLPDYQVTTVFTSASNATNEREQSQAFLSAFSRGGSDFNAALVDKTAGEPASEEMVRLIHGYVYTDRPFEKAAPSIRNGAMRINPDAALNLASVEDQLDWMRGEGMIDAEVTTETLVDLSYVSAG